MNRLGMLVDLSHVNDQTMSDAPTYHARAVIFSHSSRAPSRIHARNVPDRSQARRGEPGRLMVNFNPGFVSEAVAVSRTTR